MSNYETRLERLEAALDLTPVAPAMVLLPGDDPLAKLDTFKAEHGCEPAIVLYVRAPAPDGTDAELPDLPISRPHVMLPHNDREPLE